MQAPQYQANNAVSATSALPSSGDEVWEEALCTAAGALARATTVETVLDRLVAAILTVVVCDRGVVLLADDGVARVVRLFGDSQPAGRPGELRTFPVEKQRVLSQSAAERRPILVVDTQAQAAEIPHLRASDLLSRLTVPILVDDALLGFVIAGSAQADAFDARDIRGLEILVSLAAVALHKARLYESLQREHERLMTLASIDQQILSITDSPEIAVRTVLKHAAKLLEVPKGLSVLLPNGDAPVLVHSHGTDDTMRIRALIETHLAQGRQLLETQGEGWFLALDQLPSAPEQVRTWAEEEHVQALLAVPLWLQGRLVGLIALADTHRRSWSEDEIRVIRMLANQAVIAIDRATLARRLRERLHASENVVVQLRQLDELKGQFIRNVSHELRTPLAIVKGYVDLISDGVITDGAAGRAMDPGFAAAISTIRVHTDNLIRIVESITTLGDAGVGRLSLTPQPLGPLCEAALRTVWQQALRRHISIVAEIPADLPLVDIDAQGLLRAIIQVLENAMKFGRPATPSDADVTVSFRVFEREDQVWIQVEDKGIGIAPADVARIFERFYQIRGESTRRQGGLGIGLALVKEIVEHHYGEVVAESPGEGLGTTISIKLPVSHVRAGFGQGVDLL